MGRRVVWAALVVALLSSLVIVTGAEARPKVLDVQAGAMHPKNPDAPYEYTRFYPDALKVHRGQTVRWKIMGFHTVTYSKIGSQGFFRRDEAPGTYALPETTIFGSGCGTAANLCVVNTRTKFASTSVPLFDDAPVNMKIDLPPGKYRLFCQIHPKMQASVQVAKQGARVPTQRDVNARIAADVRKDTAAADALFKANQQPASKVEADGRRAWRVLIGDETPDNHVSILAYMPANLNIARGDRVRYVYRDRFVNEFHTVTFPTEAAGSFEPVPYGLAPFAINPSCDFDDPAGGLPGVIGPMWFFGPPCPGILEILWAPWMTQGHPAPGNLVLTPATYHDSGIVVPQSLPRKLRTLPDTGASLPTTFVAEFPAPGGFNFYCNIHGPFMAASINVS